MSRRAATVYALLSSADPRRSSDRFFLCNSGAEANEGALKVAMLLSGPGSSDAWSRPQRAFHGRTMGALSLTWNPKYRKQFRRLELLDAVTAYRLQRSWGSRCARRSTTDTAAVVVEVVQGEGGVHPSDRCLSICSGLRQLCATSAAHCWSSTKFRPGWAAPGSWFAFQHADITARHCRLWAKVSRVACRSGAVCWRDRRWERSLPAAHGSTFGGNPLACVRGDGDPDHTLQDDHLPRRTSSPNWERGCWMNYERSASYVRFVKCAASACIVGIAATRARDSCAQEFAGTRCAGPARWIQCAAFAATADYYRK